MIKRSWLDSKKCRTANMADRTTKKINKFYTRQHLIREHMVKRTCNQGSHHRKQVVDLHRRFAIFIERARGRVETRE